MISSFLIFFTLPKKISYDDPGIKPDRELIKTQEQKPDKELLYKGIFIFLYLYKDKGTKTDKEIINGAEKDETYDRIPFACSKIKEKNVSKTYPIHLVN